MVCHDMNSAGTTMPRISENLAVWNANISYFGEIRNIYKQIIQKILE